MTSIHDNGFGKGWFAKFGENPERDHLKGDKSIQIGFFYRARWNLNLQRSAQQPSIHKYAVLEENGNVLNILHHNVNLNPAVVAWR